MPFPPDWENKLFLILMGGTVTLNGKTMIIEKSGWGGVIDKLKEWKQEEIKQHDQHTGTDQK